MQVLFSIPKPTRTSGYWLRPPNDLGFNITVLDTALEISLLTSVLELDLFLARLGTDQNLIFESAKLVFKSLVFL